MHLFWKAVDSKYFDQQSLVTGGVSEAVRGVTGSERGGEEGGLTGRGVSLETIAMMGRLFRPRAFHQSDNPAQGPHNFGLFCLQAENTLKSYGFLFQFAGKERQPCEACLNKCADRFFQNWDSALPPSAGATDRQLHLENQMTQLTKLANLPPLSLCNGCTVKPTSKKNSKDPQTELSFELIDQMKAQNRSRMDELLRKCESKKTQSVCFKTNFAISREIDTQKRYILKTLIQLEKKILAEAIIKVSHAKKNQRVEVWLGKPSIKVSVRLDDLLKMDTLRENSLFKVSKTSMKCQTPYCSYNVA